jgi:hypothetical protein
VLTGYLLLTLRHRVLGQTVLAAEAHKAAASLAQVFDAPFVQRLETLLADVPALPDTASVVALARRVHALLTDTLREPEVPLPPSAVARGNTHDEPSATAAVPSGSTAPQPDTPALGEANDTSPVDADRSNSAAPMNADAAPERAVQRDATDGTAPAPSDHDAPERAVVRRRRPAGAGDDPPAGAGAHRRPARRPPRCATPPRAVRGAGIETIGVGIAIDVGALFPTAVTVNALGELRQALFRLAERLRLGVAA